MPEQPSTTPAEEAEFLVLVAFPWGLKAYTSPSREAAQRTVDAELSRLRPNQKAEAFIARIESRQ